MGLKLLHTADWHLDSPFSSLPEKNRDGLRQAQREIPRLLGELCKREGCALALLSGDIFDGNPSRETVDSLKRELSRWEIPVCISPGNHDYYHSDSPWAESWPENVHIFKGKLECIDFPELDCRVYGGGYRSMDCPPLLEGFRAEGDARWCLGVLHGDGLNLNSPYCPVTASQVRESGLDYLALGHIHSQGSFRAGDTLCAWPGCPMGRGWDETGEKGVLVVTLGEDTALRPVKLDMPCFYAFQAEIGEDPAAALERLLPPAGENNFYRVTLTGRGKVDMAALKERFRRYSRLELMDRTRPPVDLSALSGEDTLRGVYFGKLLELTKEPDCAFAARLAGEISLDILEGREVVLP